MVSRRIVRNQTEKKEIRPFHASFRHNRGAFYPCSIAKPSAPRIPANEGFCNSRVAAEESGAILRLIAYYWQHGRKVRFLYFETGADLCYEDLDLF